MDKYQEVIELSKRRGYLYPSFEIYGGVAGFWDYGPLGTRLMNNIKDSWRQLFVVEHDFQEIKTTTIGKKDVFEASGHLEGFSDLLVQCSECHEFLRADHVIEDNTDIENAEGFSIQKTSDVIDENSIKCIGCGAELKGSGVRDFNLMFETDIGPSGERPGYLRPETAQGIFIDFHRLKRYFRDGLPFGVTQIGSAYRNEINPQRGVVRLREFNQAELEYFKKETQDIDKVIDVEDVEVILYPAEEQMDDGGTHIEVTIEEALEKEVIMDESIAYFIGVSQIWYESIGIDPEKLRFRQHLPGERAHYASDCWDGEARTDRFGWIEINGVADRGGYDLERHQMHSGEDLGVFEEFDEPIRKEEVVVEPDMSELGPRFKDKADSVRQGIEDLASSNPEAFKEETIEIEVGGEVYEIETGLTGFEKKEVKISGESIVPQVIEPSFGLDRIIYSVIEHCFDRDRPESSDEEDERRVLRLPSEVSPNDVAVFPLMDKDGLPGIARDIVDELRGIGLYVEYDDSGGIGRRYRRQDEIGTPLCVTVDYDSLEDGSVTLRDRDSTEQRRVAVDDICDELIKELDLGR